MTQEKDRELLELAALAAGIELIDWHDNWADYGPGFRRKGKFTYKEKDDSLKEIETSDCWNPLADDWDALRLAVELEFNVYHAAGSVFVEDLDEGVEVQQEYCGNKLAATRRAITRAAAEIGKQLKEKNHA